MIVFTRTSLLTYLQNIYATGFNDGKKDGFLTDDLVAQNVEETRFFIHRADTEDSSLILIEPWCWELILDGTDYTAARFLERVDRAAQAMSRPPVSLPSAWSKFSHENLLAFFALPRNANPDSLRWIAESLAGGHFCFWTLTSREDRTTLQQFRAERDLVPAEAALGSYPAALESARAAFANRAPKPQKVQNSVDLERVGNGALLQDRAFSEWLPYLTEAQHDILTNELVNPLKIRGAAGSGKTLILQLKALRELYRADETLREGPSTNPLPRILYLTHSWAIAQQVEEAFHKLDERGLCDQIEVMPLTFLCQWLQGNELEVLGEDSLDGKQQQMKLINTAVERIKANTWQSYQPYASPWVCDGVEADADEPERLRLCWALLREYAEVFDTHQIKPGFNALEEYRSLSREPWMVPLDTPADRELAFAAYRLYIKSLNDQQQLTTDQMVDDFRRYLETYTWHTLRESRGYDLVFVDEFHLFSDSERYLLHHLTRQAELHPKLIMAMDPHQSIFVLLTGLSENELSRGSGKVFQRAQTVASIDLEKAHRFSKPIFEFVRYLHSSMPNMVEMGHDWEYQSPSTAGDDSQDIPRVVFTNRDALAASALRSALEQLKNGSPDQRVALVGVGNGDLEAIKTVLEAAEFSKASVVLIEGRDDIDRLRYSRRALIITAAEYAAGLQFSHVVVLGGVGGVHEYGQGGSAMRALYSQFYLGVSRAESQLWVFAPKDGEFSTIVTKALEAGVAVT
ncbi:UvrD-helicase domain-containing protein [Streptomyces sp. NPDC002763]|uniref:UvrD-helicase domain-containing protein n=1 Tax=Streptomyces sp. NPDC002763 TaxID=3154427 RepID=UPI0033181B5D